MNIPVSFPIAKLLMGKNIIITESFKMYDIEGKIKTVPKYSMGCVSDHFDNIIYAPLYSQVQDVLFIKYNIWISAMPDMKSGLWKPILYTNDVEFNYKYKFDSLLKALEIAFYDALNKLFI